MYAKNTKKALTAFILLIVLAMAITACGGKNNVNNGANTPTEKPDATADDGNTDTNGGDSALAQAMNGDFKGKKVTMFGPFTDADEVKFTESIKAFEEKTGIDIAYEGSKEFEATISVRVNGGNAPDIADFPQPGLLKGFVEAGKVVDVKSFLNDDYLKKQYNQSWLDMATMKGSSGDVMAGVWARSSVKSLVWYNKKAFADAGYTVPKTWAELMTLTDQIAKDGDPAWSIGIESGTATGWPATDWMEDIMLRTTTPENYDKWLTGELPFTDPIVKNAAEKMAEIWFNEDYVYGGRKSIATTSFGDAVKPLFDNPPKAWLHRQAGFITSFFPEGLTADDYDWFPLPAIDEQYGQPALISGDIYAMFNDRPEVRAVLEFFTTGESLKTWIQTGGVTAPMNDADASWYPNDQERRMAEFIKTADTIRFDGSDLMPGSVGAGTFWKGMTDWVSGTVDLDTALKEIQAGYKK
ncbi:alpha-glucoside transport system substrate-binding protein [Paenibacillus endophyticus]|uniref:Alpha-glucoside transport system substrate-binding protein n=1 Tax=Paenibacillus endophyticus TaxID=1294268 RepID=A0A7W5C4U6_9BACL|nr:ABC transporter substrate-binding protein [Paenibacillus endophyticus]MBB3150907.1 alpha-glucoside transport system substrate-binding protein [Paenibacillus endophyticus]